MANLYGKKNSHHECRLNAAKRKKNDKLKEQQKGDIEI
jgi:hypothetical protein